ncbi:MAG: helix-turn-helix domain-containing protein [Oscillospiraceae bacterium]|nr:helix-turn-helix domain-containing protein [Oscillospiraceae bacterium]
MNTKQVVANRIVELCEQKGVAINAIANISGVPPMTVYSILNSKSRNPGIVTIKKLCDGLEITLGQFFNTPEFDVLEQEIK